MKLQVYDLILQGYEAEIELARDIAINIDWQAVQCEEESLSGLIFQETINGVDIWHCPKADYICFSPSNE